jgi:hypothetical protein
MTTMKQTTLQAFVLPRRVQGNLMYQAYNHPLPCVPKLINQPADTTQKHDHATNNKDENANIPFIHLMQVTQ